MTEPNKQQKNGQESLEEKQKREKRGIDPEPQEEGKTQKDDDKKWGENQPSEKNPDDFSKKDRD
ncbi:hypothetical protein [Marinococcus halotolerans]|uniref:hypothetical protein n=1 Tax=Marinococcus halotolerans TaxID=301092 RepID=UPI0003B44510|nr:hypothetical protein [Marinococcus halotolerans]